MVTSVTTTMIVSIIIKISIMCVCVFKSRLMIRVTGGRNFGWGASAARCPSSSP